MRKILILFVFLLMPLAAANANTVYYVGTGHGASVGTLLDTSQTDYSRTGYVGELKLSWNSKSDPDPFVGYCLTLSQTLTNPENVDVRPLSDLPSGGNPPYAIADSGGKVAWLLNQYGHSVTENYQGAALQIAIWEVLYDSPSYNILGGSFSVTSASALILDTASSYLTSLGSNTSQATWLDSYGLDAAGNRIQAGQDYGIPAPEPGSLVLLGTGIMAIGLVFRRKKK